MAKLLFKKITPFLTVAFFSFLIGARTTIGFFYWLSLFVTAMLVFGFIWAAVSYFTCGLYLRRNITDRIEEDDTVEIETVIENKTPLPLSNFVLMDNLPCAGSPEDRFSCLINYLAGRSSLRIKYSLLCPRRGRYVLGPLTVYFFDPFGLLFFKKKFYVYSELYVYPKLSAIKKFPPLAKGIQPWFGIESARSSEDEDEFFGIREYRQGDPLRRVHWFSSARKNSLIVKQFQRLQFFRATLIFNLEKDKNFGEGKERVAEYIIRIAASVSRYLISNGVSLEIIASAGERAHITFNKGEAHLAEIMKFLSLAQAESELKLDELFQEHAAYIPDNSTLIVIMPQEDWEHLPQMLPLSKRSVSLIPLVILSSTFIYASDKQKIISEAQQKVAEVFNFRPLVFSRGDSIEEVFS